MEISECTNYENDSNGLPSNPSLDGAQELGVKNYENVSTGLPSGSGSSQDTSDPPLDGAEELGEKLRATLMEMAETTAVVKEERCKVKQEIFDRRNIANREWQLLDTKGRKEREASELETERELAEIAALTESSIEQQELEYQKYAEEAERRIKEKSKEAQIINSQIKAESEVCMRKLQEDQQISDVVRSQQVFIFKEEKLSEVNAIKQEAEKTLQELDEDFKRQMEEIKREEQRRLEEEKRKREAAVKKTKSWKLWDSFSSWNSQKPT